MKPSIRLLWLALIGLLITGLLLPGAQADGRALAMPWLILGVIILVDLVVSARGRPRFEISGPRTLFSGETGQYELAFQRALPSGIRFRFHWPEGLEGPADLAVEEGADGLAFHASAKARGEWPFSDIWMNWPSRFGLFEFVPRARLGQLIKVIPDIRPVTQGEIDLQVRTSLMGQKNTFAEGEGSEFHQLREYVPGESLRRIDWKRSARQRRMLSKETRAERNHSVIIALDNGYLMREEIGGMAKIDHAINAALATAWAAASGGDQVGLFSYDSRPRLWLPPEPGRQAFPRLRQATAEMNYESRESNHTLALATLKNQLKRRSLVIIFSDFVDTTTAELMVEQTGHLSRDHLVIFVALKDPDASLQVRAPIHSMDDAALRIAANDIQKERRIVLERLTRLGVMVLNVEPNRLTPRLVSTYLDLKAREVA